MTSTDTALDLAERMDAEHAEAERADTLPNYKHAQMINVIGQMESPVLGVHPSRCMLVRNRNAQCLRCAAVCTSGAISLGDAGIEVDPDLCIGCGTCASACPTGCLIAQNPTDEELFSAVAERLAQGATRLVIACRNADTESLRDGDDISGQDAACTAETRIANADSHKASTDPHATDTDAANAAAPQTGATLVDAPSAAAPQTDVTPLTVVCLGRADESLLVQAAAQGAQHITLISGSCASCPHHKGGELCDEIHASAQNLLGAFDNQTVLERVHTPMRPDAHDIDWRDELTAAAKSATAQATTPAASDADTPSSRRIAAKTSADIIRAKGRARINAIFPHVQADGTLPHFIPERRLRLYNSLKHLGAPQTSHITTRIWGQVSINTDICRSCRMCTVFCPTGAVSRFDAGDDGTQFGVEHRSALCVQCRMCETICPEHAITVTDQVHLDEFLSGRKFTFTMQPVGWLPGTESSIPTRMSRFMKTDTFQDPQAKMKPGTISQQRAYALDKEQKRAKARNV